MMTVCSVLLILLVLFVNRWFDDRCRLGKMPRWAKLPWSIVLGLCLTIAVVGCLLSVTRFYVSQTPMTLKELHDLRAGCKDKR